MRRGTMERTTKIALLILCGALIAVHAVHAQSAYLTSLQQQIEGIKNWYSVEGYTTDSNGNQIPLLNPQYRFARDIVDFLLIWAILFRGFFYHKQEEGKAITNILQNRKFGLLISFALSFAYVFMAGQDFAATIRPFVFNIPFLIYTGAIYLLLTIVFRKKDQEIGGWLKVGLIVLALILTYLLTSFTAANGFNIALKIPGSTSFGLGNDIPGARIISGIGVGSVTSTADLTGDAALKQAQDLEKQAEAKYDAAELAYQAGANFGKDKYQEAANLNAEAQNLAQQSADLLVKSLQ